MRRRKAGKELSGYGGNEYWDGYREALHGQCFRLPICGEVQTLTCFVHKI